MSRSGIKVKVLKTTGKYFGNRQFIDDYRDRCYAARILFLSVNRIRIIIQSSGYIDVYSAQNINDLFENGKVKTDSVVNR